MNNRILVLDGIGGIDLGRNLTVSMQQTGVEALYLNMSALPRIAAYTLRQAWAKLRNKREDADGFYCLPKCQFEVLAQQIQQFQPDRILVIGFLYKFFDPFELKQLCESTGISLYLYDTDSCNLYSNRREFIFFIEHELSVYQKIFSFSAVVTRFLLRKGLNAVFSPFGDTTKVIPTRTSAPAVQQDVIFVGSADLRRIFLLEGIVDKVTVFGQRWQRQWPLMSEALQQKVVDKPVWGEALQTKLHGSKIVLNITRTPFYGAETGINHRIFEALSMGCFVLTDHCDEIEQLFEVGTEIVTYRSAQDLVEKVDYFLSHEAERQRIAEAGHQRFLRDYTWLTRAADMLQQMS